MSTKVKSNNPFDLLATSDDEDIVVVEKPVVDAKQQSKPQKTENRAARRQKIALNDKKVAVDSTPFEQLPERKEKEKVARPQSRPKKRDHDRHSAAGKYKAGEKKEVAGKGTWGDEKESQLESAVDGTLEVSQEPVGEEQAEPVKDPEQDYRTLDQYFAVQKKSSVEPAVVARKPNEGAENQWKGNLMTKANPDEDVFFVGKTKEQKKKFVEKVKPQAFDINIRFAAPAREEREKPFNKGDKRGQRRQGPRKADRDGNVNLSDSTAFPSLS